MSTLGDLLRSRVTSSTSQPSVGIFIPAVATPVVPTLVSPTPLSFSWNDNDPVGNSPDLERIIALPRRPASPPEGVVEEQTALYKRPGGTMTLFPHQAWALKEAPVARGLLGPIGVGYGKALLGFLLPTALKARTTVLLVPSSLKDQCERMYEQYAPHWYLPRLVTTSKIYPPRPGQEEGVLHVFTYSQLSSVRFAGILDEIRPDALVLDEAHSVSRGTAARTKRFRRYVKQSLASGQLQSVHALSGTLLRRSIKDAADLSKFALRTRSPYPTDWRELESWSYVLDPSDDTPEAGALASLCSTGESVRSGFRRRLVETPGVVSTSETSIATALVFSERVVKVPAEVNAALAEMSRTWCTPGGEEITDALTYWRHARELAAGCYLRWTWPRGEPLALRREWLDARKEWHREIRDYLTHRSGPGLDSPMLLARAAAAGKWASMSYQAWSEIHKQCRPQTEVVWVSKFLVDDAVEWGNTNKGIIWFEVAGVGKAIAQTGGFPFYGSASESTGDILAETGERSIVASVSSRGTGLNLQAWSKNLLTTPSSSGKTVEQLVARTHRPGQQADQVDVLVYRHGPYADALRSAIKDAAFVEETLGARQRLTYAAFTFSP